MKRLLLFIGFIVLSSIGLTQIYDPTMSNSTCANAYPTSYMQPFMARGARNLIPNGHFNTGSYGSSVSNTAYSYRGTSFPYSWGDTYSYSWTLYPYGVPSVENQYLPWDYWMFWRNESAVWQATNIQNGYIYANLFQKYSNGDTTRNYIILELNHPLSAGTDYTFEANFNTYNSTFANVAPSTTNLQLDRIGFALTNTIPNHVAGEPLLLNPFYETPKDTIIDLANHNVSMTYTANGDERYLIIGNFHENDSITFNDIPANNSHATYAFDALKLWNPNCDNVGNVYLYDDVYDCVGNTQTVNAQHGITPYTWTLDGITLPAPDTLNALDVTVGTDTMVLIVQSGTGTCMTQDSILIIPKYYDIEQPADTMLFCDWNVDLTPNYVAQGNASYISNYSWTEAANPGVELGSAANFTVSDSGTYIIEITHGICTDYDTVHVDYNTEVLMNNLTQDIGAEHCINMYDGYIAYDTTAYPTGVHFYWTPALVSSDDPVYDSLTTATYEYYIFDDDYRCSHIFDSVPINYDSCSVISGRIYNDTNLNCTLDGLEQGIEDITVYTTPLNNFSVTDSSGNFQILVPPGTYTLNQNLSNDIALGEYCSMPTLNAPVSGLVLDSNFIGDTIHQYFHNPAMQSLYMSPIAMNTPYGTCSFEVANMGDSLDSIIVGVYVDHPILSYAVQDPSFYGMSGDTALYIVPNMGAFTSSSHFIVFSVTPNVSYIGDTVNIYAFCTGSYGDLDPANNQLLQERIVLAAYDPNVKYVTPLGEDASYKTPVAEREFIYTIHFQNTGNAPAQDVIVTDSISDLLDLTKFQFMGSSHPVTTYAYNDVVEFHFNNIFLPDSTSDEPGSHGFVQFKIDAVQSAYVGDTIRNSANIYFDNNPPIITPDAINVYYKPSITLDTTAQACDGQQINFYNQTYTTTALYEDTVIGYYYDSIYVADITFFPTEMDTLTAYQCPNDSTLFYGNYYSAQGNYDEVFVNIYGCDSTETLELIHYPTYSQTISASICPGDSINFNGNYYSASGNYTDVLQSIQGCDSTVTLQLTYNPTFNETVNADICPGDSINFNGNYYSSAGNYTDVLQSSQGCDSTVTLQLTEYSMNVDISSTNGVDLYTTTSGVAYQWIYCTTGNPITGASSSAYTPTANGSYAVIVDDGNCSDTSNCYTVSGVGIGEIPGDYSVQPNPTNGLITIQSKTKTIAQVEVLSLSGAVVGSESCEASKCTLTIEGANGMYMLRVTFSDGSASMTRIVKGDEF